jgi:HEAT repeat protein
MRRAFSYLRFCFLCVALATGAVTLAQESTSLDDLVRQLETGDDDARREAARILAESGAGAKAAVPALAKAAHDRDRQVSAQALDALANLGPDAHEAIESLIELLKDSSEQQRYRAAYALGRIGPAAVESLKRLMAEDGDARARGGAARALGWIGPPAASSIAELVEALGDEDPLGELAAKALGQIGESAVGPLLVSLDGNDPGVRAGAAMALGLTGVAEPQSAQKLQRLFHDSDARVRIQAIEAFGRVTPDSSDSVLSLAQAMADTDLPVRQASATALMRKPKFLHVSLPQVQELLGRDPDDVTMAGLLLGRIGPGAIAALDQMIQAVRNDQRNRAAMASAISRFGREAIDPLLRRSISGTIDEAMTKEIFGRMGRSATTPLTDAMEQADLSLKCAAARALGHVRPVDEESVKRLVQHLTSPQADLRLACAAGIANLGTEGIGARAELQKLTADPDDRVRAAAMMALFRIGVDPAELSDTVLAGLRNESGEVRRESARALARFDSLEPRHIEALEPLLSDPDKTIRASAVAACQRVKDPAESLVQQIAGMLDDSDAEVRSSALTTLASFGEHSAPVVEKLNQLLASASDEPTQLAILDTLGSIGPSAEKARDPIVSLLDSPSTSLRAKALDSLARISADRAAFIEIAIGRLDDEDWSVRREAARLLGESGERAANAVPKLLERIRVRDDTEFVRDALQAIDAAPPESVSQLIELLNDDDSRRVRRIAIYLLRKAGPEAKQAIPVLRKLLDDPRTERRGRRFIESAIAELEKQ